MAPSFSLPSSLSTRQSLIITSLTTCILTSSVILTFQSLRREHRTERLKKQVGEDVEEWERSQAQSREDSGFASPEERVEEFYAGGSGRRGLAGGKGKEREWAKGEFDEALIREQLTRNYNFLGETSMDKIRNAHVVIVGCGGVGSWCALMLLRSGVGHLKLIDFDMTTLSSLNRHACATLADVGSPKVVALRSYLLRIAPWATIDIEVGLWKKGPKCEKWLDHADWVVDAIDNIDTKVDLLAHCSKKGIKVFSSMGSGAKRDPTRVQIADISNTYEDPLARSVRGKLRKAGVPSGIPVVYSTEVPSEVKLLPLPEEEFKRGAIKELQAFDDFRVRILPVLGPLPAIFGLNIATYILLDLAEKPLLDYSEIKNRKRLYQNLYAGLSESEARVRGNPIQERLAVTPEDVGWVFEDLYRGRASLAPQGVLPKPAMIRWSRDGGVREDNLVVMSVKDARRHEDEHLKGGKALVELWGEEAVQAIARRSEQARRVTIWRNS